MWISGPFRAGSQLLKLVQHGEGGEHIRLETVYVSEQLSNDVASSVLVGDHLYGFDIRDVQSKVHRPSRGQFSCHDWMTGQLKWKNGSLKRRRIEADTISSDATHSDTDIGHASAIVADGKLIMLNDTGQLILAEANSEQYEELGRATVIGGEICWTAPSLVDQCIFVRNHSKAVCIYLGELDSLSESADIDFAGDIQQPEFVHLAPIILGTEPKYAMTAPRPRWLLDWFLISLALGWIAVPIAAAATYKFTGKIPARTLFLILAFCVGVFGTTIAGRWYNAFYFSWPISLYIIFECVVCLLKSKDPSVQARPVLARVTMVAFLAICIFYFWICRRLSLAFEWTFLLGFPVALPFLWPVKNSVQREEKFALKQWFYSLLAFTAFYWAALC